MPPLELWAWAFLWTCLLEIPVVLLFISRRVGLRMALAAAFVAQVITHPALWYLAPRFEPYALWLVVMETGVTATEAALFATVLYARKQPWWWGVIAAVVANLFSTAVGLWLV